jgi:hypothetical protein
LQKDDDEDEEDEEDPLPEGWVKKEKVRARQPALAST